MQYAHDVVSGRVVACKLVKAACQRHLNDLARAKDGWEYYFDEEAAQHACDFFPLFLRHSKGEWAGQPFELSHWQVFIVWALFGWKRHKDHTRRFRVAYIEVSRKNGKSTLAAGIGLYLFDADGEPGAEVYTAATKREQARIIHGEAIRMRDASPFLKNRIGKFKDNLHVASTNSKFEPLGKDSKTLDGLNVHAAIIDELHAHPDRGLLDVLDTATGARRQPLMFIITTSGSNRQSVCFEQHEYTEKILTGVLEDDEHFGIIYTLDGEEKGPGGEVVRPEDDWTEEANWIKANPNLGVSVKIDDLRRKVRKAKEAIAAQNSLKRLHFDIWTQSSVRWLSADAWRECAHPVDYEALKGQECYAGLDLSTNIDLSAFVMVFPPQEQETLYRVIARIFVPEENILRRSQKDRVPYDAWVNAGYITATPGNVIDYDWIFDQILKDAAFYNLREVAFDAWGADWIRTKLEEEGLTMIEFRQGTKSMNGPTQALEKMVLAGELAHGGNPVLTWCADNVIVTMDPSGRIKPDKAKSTERIDPIVALIMGIARAMLREGQESIYNERGVRSV